MKRLLLSSAMALTLGATSNASAISIEMTNIYLGSPIGEVQETSNGTGVIDSASMGDTFSGTLFGMQWDFTTVAFFDSDNAYTWEGSSLQGDFFYGFTLSATEVAFGTSLTWSVNEDIPVLAIFDCGNANAGDECIGRGVQMVNGPTAGLQVWGDGVSAVPVPAAAWLFGSGFIALIGFAKRKKA